VNVSVLNFCSFVSACALFKPVKTASNSVITQSAATSRKADLPPLALIWISLAVKNQQPLYAVFAGLHRKDLGLQLTLRSLAIALEHRYRRVRPKRLVAMSEAAKGLTGRVLVVRLDGDNHWFANFYPHAITGKIKSFVAKPPGRFRGLSLNNGYTHWRVYGFALLLVHGWCSRIV
jgi:hypothetical protein